MIDFQLNNKPIFTDPSANDEKDLKMCGWYYVRTTDLKRYPRVLTEARCCHSTCQLANISGCFCEPIIQPVQVIVQTDEADYLGQCVYEKRSLRLSVGCTPVIQYAPN